MSQARLFVELPPDAYIGEISRGYPRVAFQFFPIPTCDEAHAIVHVYGEDVREVLYSLEFDEEVTGVTVHHLLEPEAIIQLKTQTPVLVRLAQAALESLRLPFTLSDGVVVVNVEETTSEIADLMDQFREEGLAMDFEMATPTTHAQSLLTDRQQEVLESAIAMGYYSIPRGCTLTDLAEELGVAKSTCSEILHRIESAVMYEFIGANSTTVQLAD